MTKNQNVNPNEMNSSHQTVRNYFKMKWNQVQSFSYTDSQAHSSFQMCLLTPRDVHISTHIILDAFSHDHSPNLAANSYTRFSLKRDPRLQDGKAPCGYHHAGKH